MRHAAIDAIDDDVGPRASSPCRRIARRDRVVRASACGARSSSRRSPSTHSPAELVALASRYGMRIDRAWQHGCLHDRPEVPLLGHLAPATLPAGGAVCRCSRDRSGRRSSIARRLDLGVSSFVSLGDKADISGNDLLQFWDDDARPGSSRCTPRRSATRASSPASPAGWRGAGRSSPCGRRTVRARRPRCHVPAAGVIRSTGAASCSTPCACSPASRSRPAIGWPSCPTRAARLVLAKQAAAAGLRGVDCSWSPSRRAGVLTPRTHHRSSSPRSWRTPCPRPARGRQRARHPRPAGGARRRRAGAGDRQRGAGDSAKPVVAVLLGRPDGPLIAGSAVPAFEFPSRRWRCSAGLPADCRAGASRRPRRCADGSPSADGETSSSTSARRPRAADRALRRPAGDRGGAGGASRRNPAGVAAASVSCFARRTASPWRARSPSPRSRTPRRPAPTRSATPGAEGDRRPPLRSLGRGRRGPRPPRRCQPLPRPYGMMELCPGAAGHRGDRPADGRSREPTCAWRAPASTRRSAPCSRSASGVCTPRRSTIASPASCRSARATRRRSSRRHAPVAALDGDPRVNEAVIDLLERVGWLADDHPELDRLVINPALGSGGGGLGGRCDGPRATGSASHGSCAPPRLTSAACPALPARPSSSRPASSSSCVPSWPGRARPPAGRRRRRRATPRRRRLLRSSRRSTPGTRTPRAAWLAPRCGRSTTAATARSSSRPARAPPRCERHWPGLFRRHRPTRPQARRVAARGHRARRRTSAGRRRTAPGLAAAPAITARTGWHHTCHVPARARAWAPSRRSCCWHQRGASRSSPREGAPSAAGGFGWHLLAWTLPRPVGGHGRRPARRRPTASGIETVVGGDLACLVHLEGRARRRSRPLRFGDLAEVLRPLGDAQPNR